jgi:hypothetical protein
VFITASAPQAGRRSEGQRRAVRAGRLPQRRGLRLSGVEVTGKSGWKLRLVQTPTGEGQVIAFGPGASTGAELGACGALTVNTQNSTINDVKNVEGHAELSCTTDGLSLAGKITFENCH